MYVHTYVLRYCILYSFRPLLHKTFNFSYSPGCKVLYPFNSFAELLMWFSCKCCWGPIPFSFFLFEQTRALYIFFFFKYYYTKRMCIFCCMKLRKARITCKSSFCIKCCCFARYLHPLRSIELCLYDKLCCWLLFILFSYFLYSLRMGNSFFLNKKYSFWLAFMILPHSLIEIKMLPLSSPKHFCTQQVYESLGVIQLSSAKIF